LALFKLSIADERGSWVYYYHYVQTTASANPTAEAEADGIIHAGWGSVNGKARAFHGFIEVKISLNANTADERNAPIFQRVFASFDYSRYSRPLFRVLSRMLEPA
jgi:hypothetical protein